ncbi:PTS system transporter subunit IIB [[Clostridium] sordellii]|uniref:PTS system, IIB component n=1 Tax=Paraclostridium sordellii TaxID=1505 RepID=A0ABP1XMG8_PARSO|nr:putative pTS system, IIB component [Paeniclostridium sordellii]EPZ62443.1 putative pTS system, IIB component [[Clostridium] sordellii ATCC 9714] [Paeniclostridium sordellii ATCC 9714]CEJ72496.1 putative PTS system, IIB component [[Clostridium] sordellii] [Paeniclostridium sordellii]CEN22372.1 PTS system transporter subunit IIB [[Clostridium] sordellii] [Paeniclostridium sordellii]CEN29677.1 PTS system transporter subunit IIB [[Clostridium] sordellii] [Paeniclostridium sordellii]CEO28953.1 P
MQKIVAICESIECGSLLKDESVKLGYEFKFEIQEGNEILNKLSDEEIKSAKTVLFAINKSIEEVEDIERFIDVEYYEVQPSIVMSSAHQVIKEIADDIS